MTRHTRTGTQSLLAALCCLCLWLATSNGARLQSEEVELEAFSAITDCLPFNVKVEPGSEDDVYQLVVEGEAPLLEAVEANVTNGVLFLGLAAGFETERVIRVTVTMPKDALDTIIKASTSVLVLAPGFELEELTVRTSGVAFVRAFDAEIGDLVVQSQGSSHVFVQGSIEKGRFDVSGTSRAYCYGLTSEAEVEVEGIGRVFIDAADSDVTIEGTSSGLGRVFTTDGECSVRGSVFRSGCETIRANALPTFSATYSCGLIVDGSIACRTSGRRRGTTFTSARLDSASASTFSSSSSSGTGSSFSSASSSSSASGSASATSFSSDGTVSSTSSSSSFGDHAFESLVTTGGGSGDAVAVAATRCTDADDLAMFEVEE